MDRRDASKSGSENRAVPGPARRRRPDRAVLGVLFPVVDDLSSIAADDQLLDSIAAGTADVGSLFAVSGRAVVGSGGSGGSGRGPDGLTALLADWRSELTALPMPAAPALPQPAMSRPADLRHRRSLRPLLAVGAAIVTLLMASTAVGAHSAQPGEPLWALAQVLYTDHAHSVEAMVQARYSIDQARQALKSGDPAQAVRALTAASSEMQKVSKDDGQDQLESDWKTLWVQAGGASSGAGSSTGPVDPTQGAARAATGGPTASPGGLAARSSAAAQSPSAAAARAAAVASAAAAVVAAVKAVAAQSSPVGVLIGSIGGTGGPGAVVAQSADSGADNPPVVELTGPPSAPVGPVATAPVGTAPVTTAPIVPPSSDGPPVVPVVPVVTVPVETVPVETVPVVTVPVETVPVVTDAPTPTAPASVDPGTPTPTATADPGSTAADPSTASDPATELSTTSQLPTEVTDTVSTSPDGNGPAAASTPSSPDGTTSAGDPATSTTEQNSTGTGP